MRNLLIKKVTDVLMGFALLYWALVLYVFSLFAVIFFAVLGDFTSCKRCFIDGHVGTFDALVDAGRITVRGLDYVVSQH